VIVGVSFIQIVQLQPWVAQHRFQESPRAATELSVKSACLLKAVRWRWRSRRGDPRRRRLRRRMHLRRGAPRRRSQLWRLRLRNVVLRRSRLPF
jgi:hypothetical protein